MASRVRCWGLLALHLRREGGEREHHLVEGITRGPLAIFQVEEDPDAGLGDLLQGIGGLDLLPAKPALLAHHERLKRRPRLEGGHEPEEARRLHEFGAGDAVVDVDVRRVDRPPLARGVRAGVLDLSGDGLGLVGAVALVRRLAGIDGGIIAMSASLGSLGSVLRPQEFD
jgi:hypothetical protein